MKGEKVMRFGINTMIMLLIGIAFWGALVYVVILVVKALKKYLNSSDVRKGGDKTIFR